MGMCKGTWTSRLINGSPDPSDGFIDIDTEDGELIFGTHENSGGLVAGKCRERECTFAAPCHIDIRRRVVVGSDLIEFHYWGHFVKVRLPDGNEWHVTLDGRYNTRRVRGIVVDDVPEVRQNRSGDEGLQVNTEDVAKLRDAAILASGDWIGEKPIT